MKILTDKLKSVTANHNLAALSSQLLSPAMGLAVLGTVALIFSFFRAGQLATLVIPKDELKQVKENAIRFRQNRPKIDINSQAVVENADNSEAAMFVMAGDYKQALDQALKDLTDNPPDYLPTILEAGDILSQYSEDKELGFGLLERAVAMAPNNQYVTLRYCQRLVDSGRAREAEPNLVHLVGKYPQWPDPHIVLSKLHFAQGEIPKATTELIELASSKDLNSRQAEQVSLMLAKLGRTADAFNIFRRAVKSEPQNSFYATYCKDWIDKNPGSYETVLAMVKSSLAENKDSTNMSKHLGLEIKHGALLLLLSRPADAQIALEHATNAYPKNFDLNILLAAAYDLLGEDNKAKATFQNAANYYQPTL